MSSSKIWEKMSVAKVGILYSTITFQLTRRCSAECKICCESSSPRLDDKMDIAVILKNIDAIKDIRSIRLISVTGGEPFLHLDDVLSIAKQCREIGRQFTIITNAFWCTSYFYAFSVLSRLKENNLVACFVSADAFHQEYTDIGCVRIFLRACRDLGIPTKVQANSTKSTFSCTDEIINALGEDKLHSQVLFGAVYPVGTAKNHFVQGEFFTRKLKHAVCQYQHILHVSSDGRVQPCCSPCYAGIPFDFGNIYDDSLEDILKAISDNELMRIIVAEGFAKLLEEAEGKLGFRKFEEYVDACHLCNHLLADNDRYVYLQAKTRIWKSEKDEIADVIRRHQSRSLTS